MTSNISNGIYSSFLKNLLKGLIPFDNNNNRNKYFVTLLKPEYEKEYGGTAQANTYEDIKKYIINVDSQTGQVDESIVVNLIGAAEGAQGLDNVSFEIPLFVAEDPSNDNLNIKPTESGSSYVEPKWEINTGDPSKTCAVAYAALYKTAEYESDGIGGLGELKSDSQLIACYRLGTQAVSHAQLGISWPNNNCISINTSNLII